MSYKDRQKNILKQGKSEGKDSAWKDISMICLKYGPEGKEQTMTSERDKLSEELFRKQNQQIKYVHYYIRVDYICNICIKTYTHTKPPCNMPPIT